MRIIQLIDSLEAGGAERLAVNYANALGELVDFSGLVVTRKEGPLSNQVDSKVFYLFLNKKKTFDFKALFQFRRFVIEHKIDVVHAHSTSFFFAFLLKVLRPSVKLIWHDHYGDSEFLSERPTFALKIVKFSFNGVIVVNQKLKEWAQKKLRCRNVVYLPNFPDIIDNFVPNTILKGHAEKRIICLANLRPQKNHFLLLDVAKKLKHSHPEWTLHLVGKDFEDQYSEQIKNKIAELELEKHVFLYGSRQDIKNILDQSSIAVLTSLSEGLPVALLEYGLYKMPVVVTNVGEISSVIKNNTNGILVPSGDSEKFCKAIVQYIDDVKIRKTFSENLQLTIKNDFSKKAVIDHYINWLASIK